MFRYNGVQLSEEFSQGVIRFFGEHGDALSDDAWRTFHRWYHAVEMNKCAAEIEEGIELEFNTKEFAAELKCSWRTVENWRSRRNGKLMPDHRDERGRAVYTTEQLETARALLQRNQKTTASTPAESMSEPTTDDKPVEENGTPADTEIEATAIPVTIDADAQIVTLDQRADKIRRLQADVQRSMIEIGRELIAAKAEIGHGNWTAWLEAEFEWTDRTARYFMACAERFGNRNTYSDLKPSTLKAMLALPVGSEDEFIATQDAAGKPVKAMSARDVQTAVKEFKARQDNAESTPPQVQHGEESTDKDDNIVAAQIDDDTAKLVVGNKPLDSCRGIVCIDEDEPQRADNALIRARATVQMALAAVTAAIEKTDDPEALEAAAQSLHAIRAALEAKRKDACLEFRCEV